MSFSLISLSSSSSSIVSRTFPSFFSSETSSPPSSLLTLLRNQSNFSHVASIYRNFGSSSCSFVSSGCSMSAADYVVPRAFPSSFESEFSSSGRNSDGESSEVGSGENDEQGAETDDEDQVLIVDEEDVGYSNSDLPQRWDVLGLGQAMVDFSGMVDNEFLERLGLEKGTRKVVHHEERGKVLSAMDGCSYKAAAGGSLSNSLVALARLGGQSIAGPALNVALAGSIGSDPLGGFYRSKLRRANVNFLSAPVKDGTTGTVIVLTTSDAQRTMLAYQGTSSRINYDPCLAEAITKTNILVVEGYLFELPDTVRTISKVCEEARKNGALVAITASDVSCIERHYDDYWEIMANYADIVFANSEEAKAFCHFSSNESPLSATRYLSHFVPLVSVTDGPKGSYIGVKGEAIYIPPSPCTPVDTCGAGDAYASGILYGILRGVSDLKNMGSIASKVASVVVGQQGTRLRVQDAIGLAESFSVHCRNSTFWSDIGSDQISSL
ncbi:hypothetical protein AABB24_005879 [Solanum stoloniferum]|uniref:Carbohydrate kinase PfkB domain-containing protein n=2 Tax=Solanum TaxID=4107 RepID=A0AAF0TJ64_SOLVR|nr:uncharacterized protein LOC125813687 [Solanum verrucosum]WMV20919.1 hypothetical protein MTR67_014304 [Solanum verrucosum]